MNSTTNNGSLLALIVHEPNLTSPQKVLYSGKSIFKNIECYSQYKTMFLFRTVHWKVVLEIKNCSSIALLYLYWNLYF